MPSEQPAPAGSSPAHGDQAAPPVVGVDVGGTKLLAVRLDPDGTVVPDIAIAVPRQGADVVAEVAAAARRLAGPGGPGAIGVGVPGLVDGAGTVRFAPNLPGLAGTPVTEALGAALPGWKVWVGNDATAAGWGEHDRGAARHADDVLVVTLGTGIGGAVISGGRLVEGANRYAGEFGHMVVDPHGPRCPCGKQGCWERFASGSGLGALGRETALAGDAPRVVALAGGDAEAVRGEHVTVAAAEGDQPALEIMNRFGWWVALGLANLANILDPRLIVVGGGLISAGNVLIEPTRRAFAALVEAPFARAAVEIEPALLGSQAGAIGAGLLAEAVGEQSRSGVPEPP
jgi:glucokinase